MLASEGRTRRGHLVRWLVAGLVLALAGGAAAYFYVHRARFAADPALAAELARSEVIDEPAGPDGGAGPLWRGPRRDGASAETGLLASWPQDGPKVLWRRPCGEGYSAPAVAGGRVYTLEMNDDGEAVVCRDADTGQDVWRQPYGAKYRSDQGSGPRSTPTIDEGRVYAVGGSGVFHCLDAATGQVQWRHDLLDEFGAKNLQWGASFSPLVEGDLVFTNPGGPGGHSVAAFDKRDSRLVWKALDDPAGYSSPIAVTAAGVRQVVFFTGAGLVGLSPADGTLYWRFPWDTQFGVNAATPVPFRARDGDRTNDYLFISSGYNKGCAALKVTAGRGGAPEVRAVYEGNQMRNHFASPVRRGGYLYGFDEDRLACLELRTGKVLWAQRGFQKGSLLIADGRLIVLGENGELALAEATPEGYREQARFRLTRRKCWTVPVLAHGRLYVRDQNEVFCLDLRRPSGERAEGGGR
jgi:outer membrane protein assembly factor BamB